MSSSQIPPQLEGSHAPNSLEIFWDKHRRTVITVGAAILFALGLNYGIKYYDKTQTNAKWSWFSEESLLNEGYVNTSVPEGQSRLTFAAFRLPHQLYDELKDATQAELEAALPEASEAQRPFLLWLSARKAILEEDWEAAESHLQTLENEYPDHSLCQDTEYPVQYREPIEEEESEAPKPGEEPKLEPAVEGSMVDRLRHQIARARDFEWPARFQKPEIPEDAPRVRFQLSGSWGSFTIALFPERAPQHVERFLELARQAPPYWVGMRIDEIHRARPSFPMYAVEEFHFGLPGSKEADRTQWIATEPSQEILEFEDTNLGAFPGAVSGRQEAEGKSSAERIWINVNDAAAGDVEGERVVFGYVVEGMDTLEAIVDAPFVTQAEETAGRGKPVDDIVIEAVEVL